jgi:MinD-like ATPase involved in chromosome partitioning or flagellar assembly
VRQTELAIAMSARDWPDGVRRFLADHGGARVRVAAMGPEELLSESYDVLLVDDICSFLTPRLVDMVVSRGRVVVGVYDPGEFPDGRERLLEIGVAEVVEAGAHPDEFLAVIATVAVPERAQERAVEKPADRIPEGPTSCVLAVGGPPGGAGSTEVAIAVASRLAHRGRTVLVDADDHAPSVAQRLGLPLYPNVRTAIDILEHRSGPIAQALHRAGDGRLAVLSGLAAVGDWSEVRPRQMLDLIGELAEVHDQVVVNIGSKLDPESFADPHGRYAVSRAVAGQADRLVAVGIGTPVGVTRLLDWIAAARAVRGDRLIDVLVNRAPTDAFRRGELLEEITRTYRPASFSFLPEDARLARFAWEGAIPERGRFRRSTDRWVDRYLAGAA